MTKLPVVARRAVYTVRIVIGIKQGQLQWR